MSGVITPSIASMRSITAPAAAAPSGSIGRVSAECAFCSTALPLAEASMRSHTGPVVIQHKNRDAHAWAA